MTPEEFRTRADEGFAFGGRPADIADYLDLVTALFRRGIAAEREACAQIADERIDPDAIAAAIRARSHP